ncbi:MAG: lipase maturation factor family protein [Nitriliruptorales bacterium]|nr:lipase maturation factor family protein [Nitriliruptorales bacterium]
MEWFVGQDYWLARELLQRGVAAVYAIAFVNVLNQWRPLLGERGLTPVPRYVERVAWERQPSLFHWRYSDRLAVGLAWAGLVVSIALVVGLAAATPTWVSVVAFALLFVLYLSYVNVGQIWYAFGWESILLDAGFLAIFLGGNDTAPPLLVIILFRWLAFRIEFGAGLIKMRGDPCWRELTCLDYHHETQPLPSLFSWYFHRLPQPLHRVETAANHVAQLIAPFGLFLPQPVAGVAGLVIVVTQSWLVISGNFSWLNALTVIVALSAFSDSWLDWLPLSPGTGDDAPIWFVATVLLVTAAVAVMSWWPIRNMLSPRQAMNAAFNPLHLVNTYGAFGSVTKTRYELVIEGTTDPDPGPDSDWREYHFKGKPVDVARRPPQIAPYHLRLDWLMWFIAMSPGMGRHGHWFVPLLEHLRDADPAVLSLLREDPFDGVPPTALRVRRYRYWFATREERRADGNWWRREMVGEFPATRRGGTSTFRG